MVTIEKVNLDSKSAVNEFVNFQYELYRDVPQFCPPFRADIKLMLNKKKHPFFEFSDGEFYVARKDGKMAGRIGVFVNNPFNDYHKVKKGQFYLFECIDDQEVADALFKTAFTWCKDHGLDEIVGPKGLSAFDGYGILEKGYEHHQMMTMMNFNFPYYVKLVENLGFEKEVDFVSCYVKSDQFIIPEKIRLVAEKVLERGSFKIEKFASKRQMLREFGDKIGIAYNNAFVNNWEYYPLSEAEIKMLIKNLMEVIDPKLIKLITYHGEIVGFLIAFPDISESLKRHNGRITPAAIIDLLYSMKRTKWVALNGAGVLPEYQGRGGNALLYVEMEKTLNSYGFENWEFTQVAETAVQMRKDLVTSGGDPYKNHRVYHKKI
ncbi:MAG TPA: hypothetical protein PK040_05725 [Anaerolineaceae bacterium]|nr:hypothetical protein [Anaerolineaceae bacterium]